MSANGSCTFRACTDNRRPYLHYISTNVDVPSPLLLGEFLLVTTARIYVYGFVKILPVLRLCNNLRLRPTLDFDVPDIHLALYAQVGGGKTTAVEL